MNEEDRTEWQDRMRKLFVMNSELNDLQKKFSRFQNELFDAYKKIDDKLNHKET